MLDFWVCNLAADLLIFLELFWSGMFRYYILATTQLLKLWLLLMTLQLCCVMMFAQVQFPQPIRGSVNVYSESVSTLWWYLYTDPPTVNTYCLSISYPTREWLGYFASTLRKSNRNFIMVSPLSGPANPDFRGGFHPTSIQREPFSLITLALLLLLRLPPSSHCYSISAQGYWFSFCGVNLDLDQAELGQLTLTLIHIKAIWTAKFSSWILAPSMRHYIWQCVLR